MSTRAQRQTHERISTEIHTAHTQQLRDYFVKEVAEFFDDDETDLIRDVTKSIKRARNVVDVARVAVDMAWDLESFLLVLKDIGMTIPADQVFTMYEMEWST